MKNFRILLLAVLLINCGSDDGPGYQEPYNPSDDDPVVETLTDDELMDLTQERTFKYFWDFAESNSGAARERYHTNDPSNSQNVVTTGGSGFGLMAILVGIERGYISRTEGLSRLSQILTFFENADRFHGAWSHWIDGTNGNTIPFSPEDDGGDLVETAFLVQGLICVKEYFEGGSTEEEALAAQADMLWKGVEWDWYTQNQNTLYWHWSPNNAFAMNLKLKGHNETMIAFILGAASPDYTIPAETYHEGYANNGNIVSAANQFDIPLILDHAGSGTGPLFWAHYSFLGLNPTNLSDQYANYWSLNVNHTNINYQHCVNNPNSYVDYGEDCWGLTASYSRNSDGSTGYSAHDPENDLGIISPTAAISSIPYTPEKSLAAMHYFYSKKDILLGPAGFYDAFSPHYNDWVTERYLAIDQGPEIIMIENYRTGLLWSLFMQNGDVQNGLDALGFSY
ncbi:glucoamylase family protein [Winogradskyella bathintestinalis]|uniref:Glucoamylase family protein n=1 Tax=Winogradskyella bathintestinalis TaxID=3035208 RepID=A0ABT7ZQ17_9FLAO|nr:glucoamylase family protein [Winogradskyella bathintestinalis]MDN3491125.1 glucoamylase family protein [Winogradskyella bathintestinalis]